MTPGLNRHLDTAKRFSRKALREAFGTPALPEAHDTLAAVVARTQHDAQAARLQHLTIARLKDMARTETVEADPFSALDQRLALYARGALVQVDAGR